MLRISYKYSRASRYFYFFVTLLFAAGFLALVVLVFGAVALVFTGAFFLAGAFFTVLAFAACTCVFSAFSTAFVSFSTFLPRSLNSYLAFLVALFFTAGFLALVVLVFAAVVFFFTEALFLTGAFLTVLALAA